MVTPINYYMKIILQLLTYVDNKLSGPFKPRKRVRQTCIPSPRWFNAYAESNDEGEILRMLERITMESNHLGLEIKHCYTTSALI